MYVRHLTNQRKKAGTIEMIAHRGVRQILLRQGIIEELPDHNPAGPVPNTKRRKKRKSTDGNTDCNTDNPAAGVDGGNVEGSPAPSEVAPGSDGIRQRTLEIDSGSATDD